MAGKPRVLLVDDNPTDIQLAKFAAGKTGWIEELKTFLDCEEALDFLRNQRDWMPHLIVTDLEMPNLNGLDLLRFVKNHDDYKHIPVVVLTSNRSLKNIKEAYGLYANSVVNKPTDIPKYSEIWSNLENYWFKVATNPIDD